MQRINRTLKLLERFDAEFLVEIETAYCDCRDVLNISSWFARLQELARALEKGFGTYRQVEDHVFELKIINHLFKAFDGCIVTYEPKGLQAQGKNCDVEIKYGNARYILEVKCFHPEWKKTEIPRKHIPENHLIAMDDEYYHTYQATRGHLIDVTRNTEEKIKNYGQPYTSVLAVPWGFHLNIEDFRDFVYIYRNFSYRQDDPLGPITMHNLTEPFNGTIDQFWVFPFPQESFSLEEGKVATVVAPFKRDDTEVTIQA